MLRPETRAAEREVDRLRAEFGAGRVSLNEYRAAIRQWLEARRADPEPYPASYPAGGTDGRNTYSGRFA